MTKVRQSNAGCLHQIKRPMTTAEEQQGRNSGRVVYSKAARTRRSSRRRLIMSSVKTRVFHSVFRYIIRNNHIWGLTINLSADKQFAAPAGQQSIELLTGSDSKTYFSSLYFEHVRCFTLPSESCVIQCRAVAAVLVRKD